MNIIEDYWLNVSLALHPYGKLIGALLFRIILFKSLQSRFFALLFFFLRIIFYVKKHIVSSNFMNKIVRRIKNYKNNFFLSK